MTEAEKAALRGKLLEAELAYHRIMMGESVREFVDQNGEKVVYTAANGAKLEAYIFRLKAQLNCKPFANAPLGFTF